MGTEEQLLNDSIIWILSVRLALLYTFYFILFFNSDAQYISFCLVWHKSKPFVDFTKQFLYTQKSTKCV